MPYVKAVGTTARCSKVIDPTQQDPQKPGQDEPPAKDPPQDEPPAKEPPRDEPPPKQYAARQRGR